MKDILYIPEKVFITLQYREKVFSVKKIKLDKF